MIDYIIKLPEFTLILIIIGLSIALLMSGLFLITNSLNSPEVKGDENPLKTVLEK
jgi:hypothetical protein